MLSDCAKSSVSTGNSFQKLKQNKKKVFNEKKKFQCVRNHRWSKTKPKEEIDIQIK